MRVRLGEQTTRLQQLQSDVIAAESDLSAMRSEEDELGQGLLRDKEEVRGLQKRMKEIEDEKAGLKLLLEKLRKEARQQKGLVTIAKKQLSTAEGSRESLQKDIKEAEAPPRDAGPEQVTSPSVATPAGVPLPGTPRALSPTPTGMSQRSNNPFDKLARGPQSGVAPQTPPTGEPVTSPSLGSTALVEAGTAVGAAAGYVAAGAQTLFNAAKHAVSPETEQQPAEAKVPAAQADPLAAAPDGHDTDPFGAPASAGPTQSAFDSELGSGFGDSFSAPTKTSTAPTEDMHLAPSSEQPQRPNDFDSAFEDFGDKNRARQPEPITGDVQTMGIPSGIPKSFIPFDIRPDAERSLSTQAMASSSPPQTPVSETVPTAVDPEPARPAESTEAPASNDIEELVSSEDEREEPEDLEAPNFRANMRAVEQQVAPSRTVIAPALPVLSMPSDDIMGRVRRSAPPPPSARSTSTVIPPASQYDDLDPFGARTESTLPPGAAPAEPSSVPKAARFDDDDDFDFSDMPPAQVDQAQRAEQHPPSAFDDKFAGFDDDFDKPSSQPTSGSDNSTSMTKSYEMVAPQLAQNAFVGQSSEMPVPTPRTYDEWGLGGDIAREAPAPAPTDPKHARGISFDDAFGGAFEPA